MNRQKKFQKGITLIALVISIIVMLILAGVSLNATVGENGIITKASKASATQRFADYKEQLEMNLNEEITCAGENMRNYIPNLSNNDLENFVIINSKLIYVGSNNIEEEVAENLGVSSDLSGGTAEALTDIQNVVNKLLPLGEDVELPSDDTVETPSELAGIRLYDKNSLNGDRWKIIIDYNTSNQEIGRYGSGYYFIKAGETYNINGEDITFSSNLIINYNTNELIGLTSRFVEWSLNTTLAVNEGLVLNIDPTNLADGEWTGIEKHGDVTYDATSKALLFNESESNTTGEGGYLETTRSGIDFSNGFTFEMYFNASRILYRKLNYDPNIYDLKHSAFGLFCRYPYLGASWKAAMRFGYTDEKYICKFYQDQNYSYANSSGSKLVTSRHGSVDTINDEPGYGINEDVYLTFVYTGYDSNVSSNNYDDYMSENNVDKVEYYINGELYGYTYYKKDIYRNGLEVWNNDSCPFFIGVCPWFANQQLYYLKGKVYTTRLYTCSMNQEQVAENRNMTMKYRASF